MKKFILPILILLFATFPAISFATSGACSYHGGVDCAAGPQADGTVICNDGWTGSSVSYDSMAECSSYSYPTQSANTSSGSGSSPAGTVYAPFPGCDYFLIQDPTGTYSEAEWYSGVIPDNGDTVYGDFQTYFFKDIYDQDQTGEIHVWIEDYWISESDALQYAMDNCSGYRFDPSVMPSDSNLAPTPPLPTRTVVCPSGYSSSNGGACQITAQQCRDNLGSNAYVDASGSCVCNAGYVFTPSVDACAPIPVPAPQSPTPASATTDSSSNSIATQPVPNTQSATPDRLTSTPYVARRASIKIPKATDFIKVAASTSVETSTSSATTTLVVASHQDHGSGWIVSIEHFFAGLIHLL